MQTYITTQEAAKLLKVPVLRIRQWVSRRGLPHARLGNRIILDKEQLLAWYADKRAKERPVDELTEVYKLYFPAYRKAPGEGGDTRTLPARIDFALGSLDPKDELVVRLRFGIHNQPHGAMTLREVGDKFLMVAPERVRQRETRAIEQLRHPQNSEPLRVHSQHSFTGTLKEHLDLLACVYGEQDGFDMLGSILQSFHRDEKGGAEAMLHAIAVTIPELAEPVPLRKTARLLLWYARGLHREIVGLRSELRNRDRLAGAERLTPEMRVHLSRSVEELELSVRSSTCLRRAEILYVGDLVQRTDQEMMKIKSFGRKSLKEIKEVLACRGLSLGMIVPSWGRPMAYYAN